MKMIILMRVTFVILILSMLGCSNLFFKNKFELLTEDGISADSVKINVSFPADKVKVDIWNGVKELPVPNYYGENDWEITYSNEYKGSFRHFKTRNKDTHEYKIKIFRRANRVFCSIKIFGINDLDREIELIKS